MKRLGFCVASSNGGRVRWRVPGLDGMMIGGGGDRCLGNRYSGWYKEGANEDDEEVDV